MRSHLAWLLAAVLLATVVTVAVLLVVNGGYLHQVRSPAEG